MYFKNGNKDQIRKINVHSHSAFEQNHKSDTNHISIIKHYLQDSNQITPKQPTQFIHSVGMCRMRQFLAIFRSFFHSSPLCIFSCHPLPPTILPPALTSFCQLCLGLPLKLVPKFIYNTLLGILFSSILCTCPNQSNLFNLIVSILVGFLTLA